MLQQSVCGVVVLVDLVIALRFSSGTVECIWIWLGLRIPLVFLAGIGCSERSAFELF